MRMDSPQVRELFTVGCDETLTVMPTTPTISQLLWMHERMVQSRLFEEAIQAAYLEGKLPRFNMANGPIPGEMHLSMGQEPCAVGICALLDERDVVTAGHRAHHIAIAKGVDLARMTAEIFGRKTGLGGGRGGHMHLFDPAVNFSCSGIVGEGIAPAVGAAHARRLCGRPGIAVAFMGDGAANQGVFHEALNLAAVWRAPVLFVIEDNSYGISVPKAAVTAVRDNSLRAAGYSMPGVRVGENDPLAVYEAAVNAVARARDGGGPTLIEIETCRLSGHFVGDQQQYRPPGELDALAALDPIVKFRDLLRRKFDVAGQRIDDIELQARARVEAAIAYARSSPLPDPHEAFEAVFA
jgi:acetoin:2,6-dichlorophenolindophenol oxidoreductase subunit alpha